MFPFSSISVLLSRWNAHLHDYGNITCGVFCSNLFKIFLNFSWFAFISLWLLFRYFFKRLILFDCLWIMERETKNNWFKVLCFTRSLSNNGPTHKRMRLPWSLSSEETAWSAGDTGDKGSNPVRRAWQPIPAFLPGESHGWRRLVGSIHRVAKSGTPLTWLSAL